MRKWKDPRSWDKPGMQRALAAPENRVPPRETYHLDEQFEIDEREVIDRSQAAELRRLTAEYERGMIEGSRDE